MYRGKGLFFGGNEGGFLLRESIIGQRYFQWIEKGPVSFLQKLSLKPVHVSFWGAFVGLLTIPAYAHSLWLGGVLVLLSGFFDSLDGALARKTRQVTKAGSFMDSALDRYSDVFYVVGVWVYFACADPAKLLAVTGLTFFCLSGAYLVSYSRARGEGLGLSVSIGSFGRAERIILLGSGSILAGFYEAILKDSSGSGPDILMGTILLLLGIGSHLTAWKRMAHLYRNLDQHIH